MTTPGEGSVPALEARGIRATLGGRGVLAGADLKLMPGETVGLVGPNGAGKTTFIRALSGLLRPDAGTVWLGGEALAPRRGLAWRARRGLGYLAQGPTVFRTLSVWENLAAVPGATAAAREAILQEVGLEALAGALAATLSGGERRRLEIGRLMLMPLSVILCDEPFAGLDPMGQKAVVGLLGRLASQGCAVLITDHNVEALFQVCDQVGVLLDGTVARLGTPAELRGDPVVQARYLGGA